MRPAVCELMVSFLDLSRKNTVVKVRMASPAKIGEHWVQRQRSPQRNGLTECGTKMCANCGGGCQSCINVAARKCLHQLATLFFCAVAMKYVCGRCQHRFHAAADALHVYRQNHSHHRKDEQGKNRGHDPPTLGDTPETIEVEALDVEVDARDLQSRATAREYGGKRGRQ